MKKLKKLFKKLFLLEVWNIGISKCNIADFLTNQKPEITWLNLENKFNADPFGFVDSKGRKQIFFESYNFVKRKGFLKKITLDGDLKVQQEDLLLERKFHLSYPYIFRNNNKIYSIVESYKSGNLSLFEINEKNEFCQEKVILKDLQITDASIIFFNSKWWLFFSLANKGNTNLYLAYSDKPEGQWVMHKNNPVKQDISSSRCGGEIFFHNGFIYRPAQNCSKTYGGSLVINKITELSEENFSEIKEVEIDPIQNRQYPYGIHTISSLGDSLTLVDGKRFIFAPYKIFIGLIRVFYKFFN